MGNLFKDKGKKAQGNQNFDVNDDMKIVVMGSGGVGKSALVIKFVSGEFVNDYDPTIEDAYRKQLVVNDQAAVMDILDTAGQEEFSALQDQWMREGRGFLFVFSLTDKSSFENINTLHKRLMRIKEADDIPVVLVGNKKDLVNDREVTMQEGKELAEKLNFYKYVETSAKLDENIEETFQHTVCAIREYNTKYAPVK